MGLVRLDRSSYNSAPRVFACLPDCILLATVLQVGEAEREVFFFIHVVTPHENYHGGKTATVRQVLHGN